MRKTPTQLCYYFRKSARKSSKKTTYDIFWAFKSKLQIIHAATYIELFPPDSNNCFVCLVPYIHICLYYFLILCFYFHFLFLALLPMRHILQFKMFDSILLQPARSITEIKKYFIRCSRRKKKCHVNYNITKPNAPI